MNNRLADFIRTRRIDSSQKLRLLLFFYNHNIQGTIQELAQWLYLGHTPFLDDILSDLQNAGLLDCIDDCYALCKEPGITSMIHTLAQTVEDPLTRQELLDQIKYGMAFNYYQQAALHTKNRN